MKKLLAIAGALLLVACSEEPCSEKWCAAKEAQSKPEWSGSDLANYTMGCLVDGTEVGSEGWCKGMADKPKSDWSTSETETYVRHFGHFGRTVQPLPASFKRISDGHSFPIGAHRWQVVVGTGHSPEHACLYCPELKLLISGDQMLPKISSNVSVHPPEPDADPMADWLASLAKLKRQVPADVLVLPAHN